ncbi:nuclease [Pusillimonas caeni]|uniref:UvrD-helicase domain-containing protein n=1 Tax=Pusillimonas caeni TaxID=1348472 RepID=UPI000E59D986|nr:UvrD-helicase domain-containing protein [Pusillimonas caeni]TFL14000.1 nuclease [Pusillimonas caeni]
MSFRPPSDAAVRQAALDPTQSFLIQAPAGSGKTELLTDRILALLATVDRPEEILAITFTRKAASEMHARVLAKLRAGQGPEPDEPHKKHSWHLARQAMARNEAKQWNLLAYPARLSIRTIDSFSSWLVRATPWLSTLGGLPGVTEHAQEHYREAAKATLAMADDEEAVARLIAHLDVDIRAAQELIAGMLASRDQWLPVLGESSDAGRLLHNLSQAVEADLRQLAQCMPPGWSHALAQPVSAAIAALQSAGKPCAFDALLDWDGAALTPSFAELARWQALAGVLLTQTNTLRRTVDKRMGFEARTPHKESFVQWLSACDPDEPWISCLARIRSAPAGGYEPGQLAMLGDLVQVLWLATAQLKLRFAEQSEVDFIEVSQSALHALGSAERPSELLLKLDASIRHLLVDEFQDTSQSQIRLLTLLTAGWEPGDGRSLFLVGDPMQSIYRFRKAEVGLFLNARDEGLGEIPLNALQLTDNFRSQANIVHWVNRMFEPLFPRQADPGMGAIPYTPSMAYNEALDEVGVELHPVWTHASIDAASATRTAEAIAVDLARDALRRHADSEHPVAILVRARGHLEEVVRRLTAEGIPCRAVELSPLKSRQAVSDAVQLARALAHPADRLAWLSVLRSPLCGVTLHSLHGLFGTDHHTTARELLGRWRRNESAAPVEPEEAWRLRHACAVLLDEGNASGGIPFTAWLQHCWERLGGPLVYPGAGDRADVESLFRLIERLAPYGGLDPAELEARLEQLYAAPEGAGRSVEVMTIHKSKGLQFETVILMGMHRRPRADTQPLLRLEHSEGRLLLGPIKHRASDTADSVSTYLAEREKQRAAYEADRLLYVAVTRACQALHLVGEIALDDDGSVKEPSPASLLGRLWPYLPQPQPPEMAELLADGQASAVRPPARPLLRMQIESLPMPEPAKAAGQASAWQWMPDTAHEAAIGTVAHAWLERLGREGPDGWPAERVRQSLPVLRKQLGRAGLPASSLDEAAAVVSEALCATLSSERGQWLLRAARAHREWSLLDVSGRVSVIDLAISDEQGWLVVDYKTGMPWEGESAEAFAARMHQRHGAQLQRYCEQVAALDGRPARAALYFPRADIWLEY